MANETEKIKAIIFTRESISRLHRFGIFDEWFTSFELPAGKHGLKRVLINQFLYIIEEGLETDEIPIVVINLSENNSIFSEGLANTQILDRIVGASSAHFEATSQIPSSWRPYNENDVLSFYAGNIHRGKGARIHVKKNPNESRDLFVFARTKKTISFDEINEDINIHKRARDLFSNAILEESSPFVENNTAGIFLTERLPHGFVQGASIDEWYERKLTKDQRRFVDLPYEGPTRLRGVAGTGKTLALVVKIIKDGLKFQKQGKEIRKLCFIAHSDASVELVQTIGETLIFPKTFHELAQDNCRIEIRTLYDIANERLNFKHRELVPVSLDGIYGRNFQYELIELSLKDAWQSKEFKKRYSSLDPNLRRRWEDVDSGREKLFIAEIMNEFANVIDAERIRMGEESGDKYIDRSKRQDWLLNLPNKIDRRFLLDIHKIYRKHLAEMDALSIDEMVADFDSFLDSNAWDRERKREGYDAVFVDELHLFTALEKQTLQKLVRLEYDEHGKLMRPNIFMAYDIKQSPRDSFVDYFAPKGSFLSQKSGLQKSKLIKLETVFRYTPQIAEFLKDLDSAFPAIDIPGEWDAYVGEAKLPDDKFPTLKRFGEVVDLLDHVLTDAQKLARKIEGGGRRVAVLCVSEEMFNRYLPPVNGRYKSSAYLVDSREATSNLRHVGRRFIFSMPEYVAGLQFDTVFLIHVDQSEASASAGIGRRRQLISNVYLGASRAENQLQIFACDSRGGPSDILNLAIERRSLR